MPEAVIVDTIRTPIGRAFKGSLAGLRPDEMGAFAVDQLLERNPDVAPDSVEDVFCGCGMPQGLQAFNIGRIIVLLSEKLPVEVNGVTISRYCASSLDAIRHAGNAIKAGDPTPELLAVLQLDTLSKFADSNNEKIIIPVESAAFLGAAAALRSVIAGVKTE